MRKMYRRIISSTCRQVTTSRLQQAQQILESSEVKNTEVKSTKHEQQVSVGSP